MSCPRRKGIGLLALAFSPLFPVPPPMRFDLRASFPPLGFFSGAFLPLTRFDAFLSTPPPFPLTWFRNPVDCRSFLLVGTAPSPFFGILERSPHPRVRPRKRLSGRVRIDFARSGRSLFSITPPSPPQTSPANSGTLQRSQPQLFSRSRG